MNNEKTAVRSELQRLRGKYPLLNPEVLEDIFKAGVNAKADDDQALLYRMEQAAAKARQEAFVS